MMNEMMKRTINLRTRLKTLLLLEPEPRSFHVIHTVAAFSRLAQTTGPHSSLPSLNTDRHTPISASPKALNSHTRASCGCHVGAVLAWSAVVALSDADRSSSALDGDIASLAFFDNLDDGTAAASGGR